LFGLSPQDSSAVRRENNMKEEGWPNNGNPEDRAGELSAQENII